MIHFSDSAPVVIVGARGVVGSRVLPDLARRFPIKAYDLRPGNVEGVEVHPLDLHDEEAVHRSLKGAAAVVHLAIADYACSPEDSPEPVLADYRRRMIETNIRGTYHLYEAARHQGVSRVVYISSLTVANGGREEDRCRTDLPPRPFNFYACTKLFGENIAYAYHREHGLSTIVLRVGQPYPRGTEKEKEWLQRPRSVSAFATFGDIGRAIEAALSTEAVTFGIYNVVSRNRYGLIDVSNGTEIGFVPQDHSDEPPFTTVPAC